MDGLDGLVAGCMAVAIAALAIALAAPWPLPDPSERNARRVRDVISLLEEYGGTA